MVHAPSALPRLSLKGVPKHSPEHGRRYKSGESILKGSILPSIQGSQGLPNPRDRKGANLLFPKGNLREVPTRSINVGNVCAAMYCLFARPGSRGGKKILDVASKLGSTRDPHNKLGRVVQASPKPQSNDHLPPGLERFGGPGMVGTPPGAEVEGNRSETPAFLHH